MKSNYKLLHTYINALDYALEKTKKKSAFETLNDLLIAFLSQKDFEDIFCKQRLTLVQKKDLFFKVINLHGFPEIERFFSLFLSQDRFFMFPQLNEMLEQHLSYLTGNFDATLELPVELPSVDLQNFISSFESKINKKLNVSVVQNDSLLGGFKLSLYNSVYDMSFKTQLDIFQQNLAQTNIKLGELS